MKKIKDIKVLFLGIPSSEGYSKISPPIGLCYLSAMLKKNGFNSKIIDSSAFSWRKIKKTLEHEKPDILGVQCLTIERGQAYKMAKLAKKVLPNLTIVFGGQHATSFPEQMFKLAPTDFAVRGEGEFTMLELVQKISAGKTDFEKVLGLTWRNEDGKIIRNKDRPLIENLDDIPFPDYENINPKDYIFGNAADTLPIITSRGCPYNCAFCSSTNFFHRQFRARSAENVLAEIDYLYNVKKLRNLSFYDDNFIVNKKRLIEICQGIINRGYKITFNVSSSVRIIDDERLFWLKKAGCDRVGFGVESGDPTVLKNINKMQTPEEIERAFMLVRKHGMEPGGSLIVGCPGETKESVKRTADLMTKILPYRLSYAGILWILPDTPIYELSKQKKLISDNTWLKRDDDLYFTAEYNLKELKKLQRLMVYYQARNRDFSQKFKFVRWWIFLAVPESFKRVIRNIYYRILRKYITA